MIRRALFSAILVLATLAASGAPAAAPTPAPASAPGAPKATPAAGATELSPALKKARELGEKKDFEGAAKILRAEAEKGDPQAANALGEMYVTGRGVKASAPDALKWFQVAADHGLSAGMFNVAAILGEGAEGVPKNEAKARFLIRAAAEAGLSDAQVRMGNLAEHEAGAKPGAPDYTEARTWFEKAAAQENGAGLLAMMRFADNGYGGPADLLKGTEFCRRAARAGSIVAMNEMGVRYQKGLGVPADSVAAVGWFSMAAQHGQLAALVNLGHCYATGLGAMQDFDVAGRNYAAAAKQNFGPAQYLLAQMIEDGKGTQPNLVNAYVLYTRAGAQKIEEAQKKADELKKKLTPAQIDEAEKMLKNRSNP